MANPNNPETSKRIHDLSAIAQPLIIAILIALGHTVIQVRQDVAIIRDQVSNYVNAREFAAYKATSEVKDEQFEKRLMQVEERRGK